MYMYMRKSIKLLLVSFLLMESTRLISQSSFNGHLGGNVTTDWCGWNAASPIPFSLEHRGNQQMQFSTNGFRRLIIDGGPGNGNAGMNGGRIGIGNNLPANFIPQSRIHIHQIGLNNAVANNTYIRFTNSFTGPGANAGFAIGNSNGAFGPLGDVQMLQYQSAPILMLAPNAHSLQTLPYEWFRLQNGATFQPTTNATVRSTDGFIGLNKRDPRSHIEMVTPALAGGEEFFMAKPDDIYATPNVPGSGLAPNVQMGMMNFSGQQNLFLPGVFGNINQTAQLGPALQMLGCIPGNHDVVNREPIMRFVVGRDWIINGNLPSDVAPALTQTVINRPIFSWQNVDKIYMYMGANGRARIGYNISTGILPNIPDYRANNRWEITADAIDPYYNAAGSPTANPNWSGANIGGASGLRFTFLRSYDFVQVPTIANGIDQTKALTTDKNGDVVMIRVLGAANNGLTALNGTVQLGATCGSPSVALAALLNSREIPLNNNNFIFSGIGGTNNRVGIGTGCNPGNKLEINSGIAGASGLRFSLLTSTTATQPNPGAGVLSVDASGDVIYVPGGGISIANNGLSVVNGTVQLGATCGSATTALAALTSDREVPLNGNNFVYSGNTGSVGIGTGCLPNNKLEVNNNTGPNPLSGLRLTDLANAAALSPTNNLVLGIIPTTGDVILRTMPPGGVLGNICGLGTNPLTSSWEIPMAGNNFLFAGNAQSTASNNVGIGVTCAPLAKLHVEQSSGSINGSTGIFVENTDNSTCGGNPIIGIKSLVSNTNLNDLKCAGWFESVNAPNCFGALLNYAIIVPQGGGMVHIGYPPVSPTNFGTYLLDINGSVNATGIFNSSDASLKNSVTTLPNSLNKIKSLRPVTFKWNTSNDSASTGIHAGFIAQEVDTVIPQLVHTDQGGLKTLAYIEMIPYLVSGMQELIKKNKQQDSIIQVLTQNVASCCQNSAARQTGITGNDPKALTQINVNLSDVDMIVLNQNTPNPFAEQTTITYNVPEKYGYAQLIFKTLDGKIIKTVDITKKGRGQVNVFANDLSNGLYMYSLIVDGMMIDTKKMVKQN